MIDGLSAVLDKKARKVLGKCISMMRNLEVLVLRDAGIATLTDLNLPALLQLDLSNNLITEVEAVDEITSRSPLLQQINLLKNPICVPICLLIYLFLGDDDDYWPKPYLPTDSCEIWSVFVQLEYLEVINKEVIPNNLLSKAYDRFATENRKKRLGEILLNSAVSHFPAVLYELVYYSF